MAIQENSLALVLDPQEFAYFTGQSFRGMTVSERDAGFNIILRAYDRKHQAIYAMMSSDHPVDGLLSLLNALSGKGGKALWRTDKYAR